MKMIKEIKLFWKKLTQEIYEQDINAYEITEYLEKKFPSCELEIMDLRKKCCNYQLLKSLASLIPIKNRKYLTESFDCEDFSIVAWGLWKYIFPKLAIGMALVHTKQGKHAVNCAVYKTKSGKVQFTFIEPQTGKTFFSSWKPYKIWI